MDPLRLVWRRILNRPLRVLLLGGLTVSTALALPRGDLWWVALNVIGYLAATASLGALWLTGPDRPGPAAEGRPQPDDSARVVTASAEPERAPRVRLHREPVRPMLVRTDFLGVDR